MHAAHHPVPVAKSPGREAETRDAEKRVEDLRVDFEPNLARAVVVVAAWVAHGGRGFEEEEEEHCAPGLGSLVGRVWMEGRTYDYVEAVYCD